MKKILCSILAVLMIVSICSCSKKEDASSKFTSAKTKTDSLLSFEAEMKVGFNAGEKGAQKTENTSTVHIKVDRSNESAPVYYSEYNFNAGGKNSKSTIYYENGKRYQCSTSGEKYYYEIEPELINASFQNISIDIPENAFADSEVSSNSQGGQHIEATPSYDDVSTVLNDFSAYVSEDYELKEDSVDFEYSFSDIKFSFDTNYEGYFTEIAISYSVSFEHSQGTAEADFNVILSYINPGQQVTVEAPSDLAEYTPEPDDSDTEESTELTEEEQYEMTNEVFTLFDDDHNRVADYDTKYKELCNKYDKESVDAVIEMIEAFKTMTE